MARFWFELLKMDDAADALDQVTHELGKLVAKSSDAITKAQAHGTDDYADAVIWSEAEVIENLLGTTFVLYQNYITEVVSLAKGFHKKADAAGTTLNAPRKKEDILKMHGSAEAGTTHTLPELLNAVANYFKHRDEWPDDWSTATGQSAPTIGIVTSLGINSGSSGNLRAASNRLGNNSLFDADCHVVPLKKWRASVIQTFEGELTAKALL